LNYFRKRKPTTEFVEYSEVENEDPSVKLSLKERSESFWKLTEKLKPVQREVLWLRYGEGFSIEETAKVIEKTQLYVRVTLHRSRNELAKYLQNFTETTA
jgi:RNA polymerase sigma factor (sigma-70 family)